MYSTRWRYNGCNCIFACNFHVLNNTFANRISMCSLTRTGLVWYGWYDVGPVLRPYLEVGHYWSMWVWLSTTNPNQHTFSLLHFWCISHYSEYHGSDFGLCPHFCSELTFMGSAVRGGLGPRS